MARRWVGACLVLALSPGGGGAQVATARVEENFRAAPDGAVLARVLPGTLMDVEGVRDAWVETRLEGWVWARSLQVASGGAKRLVVSADGGENLRTEPQGTVLARLERGMLVDELERRPGWIHVQRIAWIWGRSVDIEAPPGDAPRADSIVASAPLEPPRSRDLPILTAPARGLAILAAPDGDTLARAAPGTDVQVVGGGGGWVRVRMDGWVWVGGEGSDAADSAGVPADVGPADVSREPSRYVGRLVTWELRFVSLERAERLRTDFYEGEPYLLARPAEGEGAFVYVAVPPERLDEVEDLTPLEHIEVVGRVRSGAAELTGSPILDLVELRRRPGW